jgi:hypothetical protein
MHTVVSETVVSVSVVVVVVGGGALQAQSLEHLLAHLL